jgi:hypothetical protein
MSSMREWHVIFLETDINYNFKTETLFSRDKWLSYFTRTKSEQNKCNKQKQTKMNLLATLLLLIINDFSLLVEL